MERPKSITGVMAYSKRPTRSPRRPFPRLTMSTTGWDARPGSTMEPWTAPSRSFASTMRPLVPRKSPETSIQVLSLRRTPTTTASLTQLKTFSTSSIQMIRTTRPRTKTTMASTTWGNSPATPPWTIPTAMRMVTTMETRLMPARIPTTRIATMTACLMAWRLISGQILSIRTPMATGSRTAWKSGGDLTLWIPAASHSHEASFIGGPSTSQQARLLTGKYSPTR